jgi:hypothetical protein
LHICSWSKIMDMHFNQSKGVLLWHVLRIKNLMEKYLILMHPQTPWKIQMWVRRWKQQKKKVRVCSLTRNISRVRGACWSFRMGSRTSGELVNYSHKPTQTKEQVGQCIIGTWTNHGHTQIHNTHNDPNLGEATTFPLIVFIVINHRGCIQKSFFLGLPSWESQIFFNCNFWHFGGP